MPYINTDELLNNLPNDLPYKASVKRVLMQAPKADVVPRAEVEKIFEEIEKSIANLEYKVNTPRKTVKVEELKAQVNWILHDVVPNTIAEFRKKYTEDKQ
jgi:hypothetical protein